jgi:hypothetical protein
MHAFPSWFMFLMEVITSPLFWLTLGAHVLYGSYHLFKWIYRKFRK